LPPSRFELRLGVVESRAISRGFEQLINCLRNAGPREFHIPALFLPHIADRRAHVLNHVQFSQ
jgi:hypothetical protein